MNRKLCKIMFIYRRIQLSAITTLPIIKVQQKSHPRPSNILTKKTIQPYKIIIAFANTQNTHEIKRNPSKAWGRKVHRFVIYSAGRYYEYYPKKKKMCLAFALEYIFVCIMLYSNHCHNNEKKKTHTYCPR